MAAVVSRLVRRSPSLEPGDAAHCSEGRAGENAGLTWFAFYLCRLSLPRSFLCIQRFLEVFLDALKSVGSTGQPTLMFLSAFFGMTSKTPMAFSDHQVPAEPADRVQRVGGDRLMRVFCLPPGLVVGLWKVSPAQTPGLCSPPVHTPRRLPACGAEGAVPAALTTPHSHLGPCCCPHPRHEPFLPALGSRHPVISQDALFPQA